ncbi:MAG: DNA helicase II [Gammaproteobacteria bacterium TMED1]|nr:MAG: DNA helicase II [Gammaproteobacteria bacterium TMED1]
MDVSDILEPLNDAQREAVTLPRQSALVLAGAGSGKTRVLTHRIAWLIKTQGISPFGLLAVTFTNKAAAEMRGRIESLLEMPLSGMWVGTFHGIAHRLLRRHYGEAGLPQNFQIMDTDDQLRLVKRVTVGLDLDEKKWPPRQAVWFINSQKDEGLRPKNIEDYDDLYLKTNLAIYEAYQEACERGGMVDFAELLLRAHELWLNHPGILRHYQERFSELLVDEFQDTNAVQYAWLRVLAGENDNLLVVGDDDQSIYGWRGARIENIQRFSEDFDNSRTIRLEQNYRSTGSILKAANHLIGNNEGRLGKELWTDGGDGDLINLYSSYNEIDEARYIAERINRWVADGNRHDESAILYRSNAQSRVLEEAMLRLQLPYRIYGGQRFFERAEIRNALGYVRLVNQRDADAAFERVVNVPPRGMGNRTLEEIRHIARSEQLSLWRAAKSLLAVGTLTARKKSSISGFLSLIEDMDELTQGVDLEQLVRTVIERSGLISYYEKERGERGQARIENLGELVTAARSFDPQENLTFNPPTENEEELSLLDEFLSHASLEAGEAQGDSSEDCVQLMTMHSAKGLEFPLVFLAGMEEGLFPHRMSLEEPGRLEEERRLCYVGVTRAMRHLYLTHAETRRLNGTDNYNRLSRFITEIPEELIQEVRLKNTVVHAPNFKLGKTEGEFSLGQRVHHAKFGEGVVLNYEGQGKQARVHVNFSEGSKWLMVSFANLQTVK